MFCLLEIPKRKHRSNGLRKNGNKKRNNTAVKKSTTSLVVLSDILKTMVDILCSHFWPGLGLPRPKAIVVIPQNQPLPKHLRKKTSKSAKHACHYATKERPVKITMYLGLDIIIKTKFTTIFDRCAILNVLNYLTKNFES